MWRIGQITGEYLARMENLLSLYHLPFNEKRPVVCLDELLFQLLGNKVEPLEMKSGAVKRLDYEYHRCGTASVFVAFEPLTGKRLVEFTGDEPKPTIAAFNRQSPTSGQRRK